MTRGRRWMVETCGAIAVIAIVAFAPPAYAQSEAEIQQARAAFEEAVRLMQQQRFSDAIPLLERSLAIRETAPVVFNLGLAYRGTGDFGRSMEALRRVVTLTEGVARQQELRARALQIIGELASSRAQLVVVVRGGATAVAVDGRTIANGDGTYEREVDPGRHTVEVRRTGYEPVTHSLEVRAGGVERVELDASARPITSTLRVSADPPEADVRIDGALVGTGLVERAVAPGRHVIEVRAQGYRASRLEVSLEPGSMMVREIVLAPDRRRQRDADDGRSSGGVLSQWWFWTAVGAVVVGGAVVAIVAAQPGTAPYEGGSLGTTVVALPQR
ncbi:MAG: PEGA domain-containing protein [Deltaproteobacteria bacterium]|nr:PEGA domain-containing protein [Deltaproteobacteria bacterium]